MRYTHLLSKLRSPKNIKNRNRRHIFLRKGLSGQKRKKKHISFLKPVSQCPSLIYHFADTKTKYILVPISEIDFLRDIESQPKDPGREGRGMKNFNFECSLLKSAQ